jgi:hypothetical protein
VTMVMSFNQLFAGVPESDEKRLVMAVAKGSSKSHVFRRHSHAGWNIGFTNSSNPFYLFLKLNRGLLLLAPSAPTMRQEHPLLIALEADRRTFMSRTAPAQPGVESSRTQMHSSRRSDQRRETDGSQIAQSKFVEAHGCFTVGGR